MNPEVIALWREYRRWVNKIYVRTDFRLEYRAAEADDGALEALAEASQALTEKLREELGPAAERASRFEGDAADKAAGLETAALAAATVDIAIAGDITNALRRAAEAEREQPLFVEAPIEEHAPSRGELEPLARLLAMADNEFPEWERVSAGGAPGALVIEQRARDAVDELVGDATPPAIKFGTGLISVGASGVLDALELAERIGDLADRARDLVEAQLSRRARFGLKLIESGVGKAAALIGIDPLRGVTSDLAMAQVEDAIGYRAMPIGERIVRWTVRTERCEDAVRERLGQIAVDTPRLDGELAKLCARYSKDMRWAGRLGKGLGWCSLAVTALSGGAGLPVIAGANGVGLVVVLFTLADRLDTLPALGRNAGVPTIVSRCRL